MLFLGLSLLYIIGSCKLNNDLTQCNIAKKFFHNFFVRSFMPYFIYAVMQANLIITLTRNIFFFFSSLFTGFFQIVISL
jgi:hypothetical protein